MSRLVVIHDGQGGQLFTTEVAGEAPTATIARAFAEAVAASPDALEVGRAALARDRVRLSRHERAVAQAARLVALLARDTSTGADERLAAMRHLHARLVDEAFGAGAFHFGDRPAVRAVGRRGDLPDAETALVVTAIGAWKGVEPSATVEAITRALATRVVCGAAAPTARQHDRIETLASCYRNRHSHRRARR